MQVSVLRKGQVFFCPIISTDDDGWKDSSIVSVWRKHFCVITSLDLEVIRYSQFLNSLTLFSLQYSDER